MKNQDYTTRITVDATPREAFECINSVTKWWTENLEGRSQKPEDEFTVRFGTTWKTFKITEVVPDKKVVWQVKDCYMPWNNDKTEWTGTKISFEITEENHKTQIRFTHIGLIPAMECFGACSNAWAEYIQESLLLLVNTGKGKPTPKDV